VAGGSKVRRSGDRSPPVGSRGEAPVEGLGGRSPPEAEAISEK